MRYRNLLQQIIGASFVTLILGGCGVPVTTPTSAPPTDTPIAIPPTDTPTPAPPTDTPTTIPPTDIPTTVRPTTTATATSADDVWKIKADMPTGRWEHSSCVVDGKIYAIGGAGPIYHALNTMEVYDPVTDTWTVKSEMPTARQGLSASVVNGKIYAIGGSSSSTLGYTSVETYSTVEEFDPATDTWTTKSPMPTRRIGLSTTVLDGKIYVIGGYISGFASQKGVTIVDVYDPAMDTWTTAPDMPTGRFGPSTSVVDGKIYVIGGMAYWNTSAYGLLEVYDPQKD